MCVSRVSVLFAFCFWSISTAFSSAQLKTISVDINKLYYNYHITKKINDDLIAEHDLYVKKRQKRRQKIAQVAGRISSITTKLRKNSIHKSRREDLVEEYENLVGQYNAIARDIQDAGNDKLIEVKKKISIVRRKGLDEITKAVKKYAKDNGYQWVIETSGVSNTTISPIIYAKNTEDKTEEILAILNKDVPKKDNTKN